MHGAAMKIHVIGSDFNENWVLLTDFLKIMELQIS